MHNDNILEISENTLIIPELLMASKLPWYRFFVFLKKHGFSFLTVTKTALLIDNLQSFHICHVCHYLLLFQTVETYFCVEMYFF